MKGDATSIRTLREHMQPSDWNTVAGSMFSQLGAPNPGQAVEGSGLSFSKWLTDYNKLRGNDEAFKAAFQGPQYAKMSSTMDDLSTVANGIRAGKRFGNPSRSGYVAGDVAMLGSMLHGGVGIPALGMNYLTAQVMGSPTAARALRAAVRSPNARAAAATIRALMVKGAARYAAATGQQQQDPNQNPAINPNSGSQ
jgi:hypothetical protein